MDANYFSPPPQKLYWRIAKIKCFIPTIIAGAKGNKSHYFKESNLKINQ